LATDDFDRGEVGDVGVDLSASRDRVELSWQPRPSHEYLGILLVVRNRIDDRCEAGIRIVHVNAEEIDDVRAESECEVG
jgi:hypothetical protein